MVLFYQPQLQAWAGGTAVATYVVTGLVGVNFLLELGVNLVLSPTITRLIAAGKKARWTDMLLALDVGNTNIVIGFLDESGIRNIARLETDRDKTAHEYAISLRQVIEFSGIAPENIDGAICRPSCRRSTARSSPPCA